MACLFPEFPEPVTPQERTRMHNARRQRDYRSRPENAHKIAARHEVARAIRRGDVVVPGHCEDCGCPCSPEAHHSDHNKPLVIVWLCRLCHGRRHRISDVLPGQLDLPFGWNWSARGATQTLTLAEWVLRAGMGETSDQTPIEASAVRSNKENK